MKIWRIAGRYIGGPPPSDWRARLVTRLGHRPRRLGEWVELALFGALNCMDAAGEAALPHTALLSLGTMRGPDRALRNALLEAREDLPLPIGFLNSQPNQVLPALAQHLGWQGDGRCLTSRDPVSALMLAGLEAGPAGMLIGWVDEDGPGKSIWLRLVPDNTTGPRLRPGHFGDLADTSLEFLAWEGNQLSFGTG